ncbi:hypothetical protein GLOIN_2v1840448 [Rhizophagus irregularis DAOM 181602=DAOM 197198]|uniref:Uncharacterized protein n=1 Tax=Rhizophagus irregularis (strain DAOM 181602 / DAOM 197198 / MUCL 43194) TaxID=747089 RepID=A0A2P4Q4I8_RHIID|nr:hypothetical protein GLOIN_2v1840448 [Rhizophagus irregularis DAOM 181602=DAOM 197198]POG72575.1 hypothetical protein GLOIN_2v1840448 [Rhizophagus irregularis DAOM 181602=DAOM 197198]|eukprot:XP_025179441.1 hypothetical protein GLOIN_2v1840448 [Rhizophagus irregularis DAOM 181602=DAOM 197198]
MVLFAYFGDGDAITGSIEKVSTSNEHTEEYKGDEMTKEDKAEGMKSHTVLNKCNFIITVVNDAEHQNSPGFLCDSKENQLGVCSSPTEAINTCYEKVFRSNAKFPGPHSRNCVGNGKIKKPEWNYAEEEYKSILQSNFNGIKSAFVQEIEDNEYVVQIYTNDDLIYVHLIMRLMIENGMLGKHLFEMHDAPILLLSKKKNLRLLQTQYQEPGNMHVLIDRASNTTAYYCKAN